MSRIQLSSGWINGSGTGTGVAGGNTNGLAARLIDPGTVTIDKSVDAHMFPLTTGTASSYVIGEFCIMKGTMPNVNDFTGVLKSQSVDKLISWDSRSGGGADLSFLNNTFTFNFPNKAAFAAGTASWFWIRARSIMNTGDSTDLCTVHHSIMGTVGILGSGCDLEIPALGILLNTNYRLVNFKLTFPTYLDY